MPVYWYFMCLLVLCIASVNCAEAAGKPQKVGY